MGDINQSTFAGCSSHFGTQVDLSEACRCDGVFAPHIAVRTKL